MKRKIASAMCLVMMGVNFAAPVYADATRVSGTGSGSTTYVSTEHYEVIVPTTAALSFKLDPQGLIGLEKDKTVSVDKLQGSTAGAIYGTSSLLFANLGTDDVSISAKFNVAGNTGTTITTMADNGDVQVAPSTGNSAFNVKLALVPLAVEKNTDVTYSKGADNSALFAATATAFTDASKKVSGIAFDNTNSAVSFSLAHPSWNIKSKGNEQYELEMDETTNDKAVAFQIGGYCNSKADWSDFTKDSNPRTISLTATFTIDKAASDFAPTAELNLADKTVAAKNSGKLIEVPTQAAAETAKTLAANLVGNNVVINPAEGKTFSNAVFQAKSNGNFTDITGWGAKPTYNSTTGNWELPISVLQYLTAESDGSYAFKVAYSDAATTLLDVSYKEAE